MTTEEQATYVRKRLEQMFEAEYPMVKPRTAESVRESNQQELKLAVQLYRQEVQHCAELGIELLDPVFRVLYNQDPELGVEVLYEITVLYDLVGLRFDRRQMATFRIASTEVPGPHDQISAQNSEAQKNHNQVVEAPRLRNPVNPTTLEESERLRGAMDEAFTMLQRSYQEQMAGLRDIITKLQHDLAVTVHERDGLRHDFREARRLLCHFEQGGARPWCTPCHRCGRPTPVQLGHDGQWYDGPVCQCLDPEATP